MFDFDCQWLNRLHVGLLGLSITEKTTAEAAVVEAEATAAVEQPLESKAYLRSLKAGGPLGSVSLQ